VRGGEKGQKECREGCEVVPQYGYADIYIVRQVYDEKSKMYLVLDLVTGGELFDRIVSRGHYTELDASQLMVQVLGAIG
jgi:calcium/calmodulin-dependent protein kinase I